MKTAEREGVRVVKVPAQVIRERVQQELLRLGIVPQDDPYSHAPPTEEELDLTCGDDEWILLVWPEDDGSVGWDASCCVDDC